MSIYDIISTDVELPNDLEEMIRGLYLLAEEEEPVGLSDEHPPSEWEEDLPFPPDNLPEEEGPIYLPEMDSFVVSSPMHVYRSTRKRIRAYEAARPFREMDRWRELFTELWRWMESEGLDDFYLSTKNIASTFGPFFHRLMKPTAEECNRYQGAHNAAVACFQFPLREIMLFKGVSQQDGLWLQREEIRALADFAGLTRSNEPVAKERTIPVPVERDKGKLYYDIRNRILEFTENNTVEYLHNSEKFLQSLLNWLTKQKIVKVGFHINSMHPTLLEVYQSGVGIVENFNGNGVSDWKISNTLFEELAVALGGNNMSVTVKVEDLETLIRVIKSYKKIGNWMLMR